MCGREGVVAREKKMDDGEESGAMGAIGGLKMSCGRMVD